ncbi:MAG TPA: hypothetical protein VFW87_04820 [Pirellulales bacterium]|nr:hypothetical protein [Pirellulales bacterium]
MTAHFPAKIETSREPVGIGQRIRISRAWLPVGGRSFGTGAAWVQRVLRLANTPEQSGRTAATPPPAQVL